MERARRTLVIENMDLLQQLKALLIRLPPDTYGRVDGVLHEASIGQHVRHVINHYDALLHAVRTIDYESRVRGGEIESDPTLACARLDHIATTLLTWLSAEHYSDVRVREIIDSGSDAHTLLLESSVERELAFLVSHTTHHMALVAVLARLAGVRPDSGFGVARATRRYRERTRAYQAPAVTQ